MSWAKECAFWARLSFVAVTIGVVLETACGQGLRVSVANRTTGQLSGVELVYSGGSVSVGGLASGETRTVAVAPRGESDLTIRFIEATGREHEQKIDVYLETGYRGHLTVTIQSDFRVRSTGDVHAGPF